MPGVQEATSVGARLNDHLIRMEMPDLTTLDPTDGILIFFDNPNLEELIFPNLAQAAIIAITSQDEEGGVGNPSL